MDRYVELGLKVDDGNKEVEFDGNWNRYAFNIPILYLDISNSLTDGTPYQIILRRKKHPSVLKKVDENFLPPSIEGLVTDEFCKMKYDRKDCMDKMIPAKPGGPGGLAGR